MTTLTHNSSGTIVGSGNPDPPPVAVTTTVTTTTGSIPQQTPNPRQGRFIRPPIKPAPTTGGNNGFRLKATVRASS